MCDRGNKVTFTSTGGKIKKLDTGESMLTAKRYKMNIEKT